MRPATPFLLLLLLVFLLPLASSSRFILKHSDERALSHVCHGTRNSNLCQHTAKHYLFPANGTVVPVPAINAASVLSMHIEEAKRMTRHALEVANRLCNDRNPNHRKVVTAVKNCLSDDYPSVTNGLDQASKKMTGSIDLPSVKIELSAVLTGFVSCDDEFVRLRSSPLSRYNGKLEMVTRIMLDLASLIKK